MDATLYQRSVNSCEKTKVGGGKRLSTGVSCVLGRLCYICTCDGRARMSLKRQLSTSLMPSNLLMCCLANLIHCTGLMSVVNFIIATNIDNINNINYAAQV